MAKKLPNSKKGTKPLYPRSVLKKLTPEQRAAVLAKAPQDPCLTHRVSIEIEATVLNGERLGDNVPIGTVQGDEFKPPVTSLLEKDGVRKVIKSQPARLLFVAYLLLPNKPQRT